ncbi:hypothetical protein [Niallia sp. RD1]|uniref:hypothetical protein n=1 Tax=Niallia sp. RD1 TaxID=2962858 RepID=UPI0020C19BF2|nr:hypothetical protein [Niallia sp. RD1]UTI41103.1 hypothetical protein NKG37_19910 [Niallia sp. RD1]
MTRYVGIDPSTKTGLVILNEDGEVLHTEEITTKKTKDPQRFIDIANKIKHRLAFGDVICIEGFSYGSKGKGVSTQYGIGWQIRSMLVTNGFDYYEVAPGALKKFASGKGNTKKDELVLPIYKRWGFESTSDNIRDAYILSQIARGIEELGELTKFQYEVVKTVKGA